MRKVRNYIFLKDVAILSVTAFGGPQAHLAMFLDVLVNKHNYLKETELIELNALCQILPGPTSTQTLTAIGYKMGGAKLAYLTLLIWILPAVSAMIFAGMLFNFMAEAGMDFRFTRFIQPMAVGIVSYAAYAITIKVVNTKTGFVLLVCSALLSFYLNSPFAFPVILLISGFVTAGKYKQQPIEVKSKLKIDWRNFFLWAGVFLLAIIVGLSTRNNPLLLPFRLFENFYRNGSMIFGGGQILIPLLYTEFVEFKHYLTGPEFLSGYSLVQALPGPVFSFSSYVGSVSMRHAGLSGELIGGLVSSFGIFLPGTFLIFFVIRFWDSLKKYRWVRASLEGITAASSGMVIAAAILLFRALPGGWEYIAITIGTFFILAFTKIPTPFLILIGLIAGIIF